MTKLILLAALFSLNLSAWEIDLHNHLFMKQGLRIFRGGFFKNKIKAKHWKHRSKSQVNEELLNKSNLKLVVVALYATPIINGPVRKFANKQIDLAEKFVKRNPNWIIAKSSVEARKALNLGKRVLVLSLEGATGYIDSKKGFEDFYDRGVRIVTLIHLVNDKIGGTSFRGGFRGWLSLPQIPFCKERDPFGIKINCKGLNPYGLKLVNKMIDKGFWIDLTHSSDKLLEEVIPVMEAKKLPLLFTHTTLRKYKKTERTLSENHLNKVAKSDGIIGLLPSAEYLGKVGNCQGSVDSFQIHYNEMAKTLPLDHIMIGSDVNGMVHHLKPRNHRRCPSPKISSKMDKKGFWNSSHHSDLYNSLGQLGSQTTDSLNHIETFLNAWERVENAGR